MRLPDCNMTTVWNLEQQAIAQCLASWRRKQKQQLQSSLVSRIWQNWLIELPETLSNVNPGMSHAQSRIGLDGCPIHKPQVSTDQFYSVCINRDGYSAT